MKWYTKVWNCIVGSPEECGRIEDPEVLGGVRAMVKRAFVFGILVGFFLFALLHQHRVLP